MNVLSVSKTNACLNTLSGIKQRRVVFVDGVYSKELSKAGVWPSGVALDILSSGKSVSLSIPDKVVVEELVHILFLTSEAGQKKEPLSYSSDILIHAGASTRLKIILNDLSTGDRRYESKKNIETRLAPGACVSFYEVKRGGEGTSVSTKRFYLKRHSDLDFFEFAEGGDVTRSECEVHFEEEHGFCSLKGLAILDGRSQVSNRITAFHKVPHCISRQFYKNVLAGKSKTEFNSLVEVVKGALKSDSRQLNKNILLSDEAQAKTGPKLKIDADDVSCTHGATVGQLEKDELFYLTSRGLSKEFARFLLVYGFAEEVLEGMEPAGLKEELEALVNERLKTIMGGSSS